MANPGRSRRGDEGVGQRREGEQRDGGASAKPDIGTSSTANPRSAPIPRVGSLGRGERTPAQLHESEVGAEAVNAPWVG